MRTIAELRSDQEHKRKCALDIIAKAETEGRICTAEEFADIESLQKEAESAKIKADHVELLESKKTALTQLAAPKPKRQTIPEDPGSPDPTQIAVSWEPWERQLLYSKLTPGGFKPGSDGLRDAFASGHWIMGTIFKRQQSIEWCRRNYIQFAQSEGVNSAGGALVPAPLSQSIINLREMYGVFRQNCEVIPMGSDTTIIPRAVGGLTATFTAENATLTESDQDFDNVTLRAQKLAVLTRMSTELAEDAVINIADMLARQMAEALAYKEDLVGFDGDGSASHGFIQGLSTLFEANTSLVGNVSAAAGNDNIGELDLADFHSCMSVIPAYALRNAKWYCSSALYNADMVRLAAAAGGNTTVTLANGMPSFQFLGYPVVISQVMPASLTTDYSDVCMLFFGDLRLASAMGDRRGITVQTSSERYFDQDQIGIRCIERIDINNHDIGSTSAAGPIVTLTGVT